MGSLCRFSLDVVLSIYGGQWLLHFDDLFLETKMDYECWWTVKCDLILWKIDDSLKNERICNVEFIIT